MPSKTIRGIRRGTKEETFLRSDNGDGHNEINGNNGASRGYVQAMMPECRFLRRLRKRQEAKEIRKLNRKNK